MLSILIGLPLVGSVLVALLPPSAVRPRRPGVGTVPQQSIPVVGGSPRVIARGGAVTPALGVIIAQLTAGLNFVIAILLWIRSDDSIQFQYIEDWGTLYNDSLCHLILGVDGISLLLLTLTTFISILLILCPPNPSRGQSTSTYMILILVCESMLIAVFVVLDLLLFYISYESVLIPMFLIIIIWGSRERKIKAAYQLFIYTLIGSLFMLLGIIILYYQTGTTDYLLILGNHAGGDKIVLARENLLWMCYFLSFAVKVPMWPIYGWLPEAHTEAPTGGSMLLAGILLKLAGYGFIRYSLPLFPNASEYFTTLIYSLATLTIIQSSLSCLRQIDLKKIIAYSSIGHMGVTTLGIFSSNISAIQGSIFMMISHGIVSPALFYCIGILYDRSGTRLIKYMWGITITQPLFSVLFFIGLVCNMGVPGTIGFPGEYLCYYGSFLRNPLICLVVTSNLVLCSAYSIWLCNRILFGTAASPITPSAPLQAADRPARGYHGHDITRNEYRVLLPFIIAGLLFGLVPTPIMTTVHYSCSILAST